MLYLSRLESFMKKLLTALCLISIPALAQVGIVRSISGIHAPSAKTLPQGSLFISGSFEMVSDGHSLSVEEGYTNKDGEFIQLDQNTPSNTENLFVSFALKDNSLATPSGIRVGTPYQEVVQKFGSGDVVHISGQTYYCYTAPHSAVEMSFVVDAKNIITEIHAGTEL